MKRCRVSLLLTLAIGFGGVSCGPPGPPGPHEALVPLVQSQNGSNLLGTALVLTNSIWSAGRLILVDLNSGQQTVLVDNNRVFGPTFSPDGQRVAYALDERIYTIAVDGSDNQDITHCAPTSAGSTGGLKSPQQPSLSWGLDNKIYWTEFTNYIWQVDTQSKIRKRVYTSKTQNWRGQVSIDGQRAVVWKSRPEFDDSYAYTIDIKNNNEKLVRSGCNVAISDDGNQIFHMVDPHTKGGHYRQFDHTHIRDLPPPSGASDAGNYRFSTFSPAFLCVTANPTGRLNTPFVLDVNNDHYYRVGDESLTGTIWDFKPGAINQQPSMVEISTPFEGAVFESGTLLSFSGIARDPEDGDLTGTSLAWSIDAVLDGKGPLLESNGDGGTFTIPALTEKQDYLMILTATDSAGLNLTDSLYFSGVPVGESTNRPPLIEAVQATPNPVAIGRSVSFACTASDSDSDPLQYTWDFGNEQNATGANVEHTYNQVGTYPVRVSVQDGHNQAVSESIEVRVLTSEDLPPSIELESPAAQNLIWLVGSKQAIAWSAINVSEVTVEFSIDGGSSWTSIADAITPTDPFWGYLPWTVPPSPTLDCFVRIRGGSPEVSASSPHAIEIREDASEPIQISRPMAGEVWPPNTEQAIQWSSDVFSDVRILFSADGGNTWKILTASVDTNSEHWGAFPWTSPDIQSTNCIIRISDYGLTYDIDSALFTIGKTIDSDSPSNTPTIVGQGCACRTSDDNSPLAWLMALFLIGLRVDTQKSVQGLTLSKQQHRFLEKLHPNPKLQIV